MSRIFLINVGANSSHPVKSPLFPDKTFELLPIPERVPSPRPPMVRYANLHAYNRPDGDQWPFLPLSYHQRYCHYDPEFETYTYGDDPRRAPRAAALQTVQRGDWLLFLARLWVWQGDGFSGGSGFFLVARLEVENVLRDVRGPLATSELLVYSANAHVRRAQADPSFWNGFWVFKGGPRSRRFSQAIELTPEVTARILRDKHGLPWVWRPHRTPLQTIGSYTRTIRCIAETESEAFLRWPEELRSAVEG